MNKRTYRLSKRKIPKSLSGPRSNGSDRQALAEQPGMPTKPRERDPVSRVKLNALTLQQGPLHPFESGFRAYTDLALRVDDAMPGQGSRLRQGAKRVSDHTRLSRKARECCYLSVSRDTAARYPPNGGIDLLVVGAGRISHFGHCHNRGGGLTPYRITCESPGREVGRLMELNGQSPISSVASELSRFPANTPICKSTELRTGHFGRLFWKS